MKFIVILLTGLILIYSHLFSQKTGKITYISNDGFLVEADGKKVLIDALFNKIDANWCDSPAEEIVKSMRNSTAPFNNIDIIAISHKHIDHFSESVVIDHLLSDPKSVVICPEQVGIMLVKNPKYSEVNSRIIALTPELYCDTNIVVSNIPIRVLRLEHSHYMIEDGGGKKVNKHRNIENLGYVFEINSFKIFHCGDTNPFNEKEYSTFALQKEKLDIAFLERLLIASGGSGIDMANNYVNPEKSILMHIAPANIQKIADHFRKDPKIIVFENKMDSIIIDLDK